MLEDLDHLYRYAALLDRLEGKDANTILGCYTDLRPGRPAVDQHRAPEDDVRDCYDRHTAQPLSRLHALTILSAEQQARDFYMSVGPTYADPVARQLYAEIASIEEQHVTQYESIIDPEETLLEKWLLHECNEVYTYYGCAEAETDPRVKKIWERFCDWELGHLHHVMELFRAIERRDPAEILPATLPAPIAFESHRMFVRDALAREVGLTALGTRFVPADQVPLDSPSIAYNKAVNADGSPSQTVAAGWHWLPGTELAARAAAIRAAQEGRVH
jgi:hypothetical protein